MTNIFYADKAWCFGCVAQLTGSFDSFLKILTKFISRLAMALYFKKTEID